MTPDAEGRKLIKELGLSDRLREPKKGDERTETFLSFRHKEYKADGDKADPIRVVDADAKPWNKDENGLIGNGSEVNLKFAYRDYGRGKKPGMYIRAVQVINLVPYVVQDFAPVESDEEYFATGSGDSVARLPDGMEPELDDDIPGLED